MTNEEIWRTTDLRRYIFSTIPQHVFDQYREELASMAVWLKDEAEALHLGKTTTSWGGATDLNMQPEIFDEYQEDAEALTKELIEQAMIGIEIADGEHVTIEVTPEQWTTLNLGGILSRYKRDSRHQIGALDKNSTAYLDTPYGTVHIQVKLYESPQ